jgi:hypothetical protein
LIVIERPAASSEPCQLSIEPGMPKKQQRQSQQVGASDVFAGALALGMSGPADPPVPFPLALDAARLVTQTYQHARWHHVPDLQMIANEPFEARSGNGKVTARPFGTPYLPPDATIDLGRAKTCVPGIYSVTPAMCDALTEMVDYVVDGDKSMVLVASGGSGKSNIAKQILATAGAKGLEACSFDDLNVEWSWNKPKKTIRDIAEACKKRSSNKPFVIVDEALKRTGGGSVEKVGMVLLDEAEPHVRFLLIDADFAKLKADKIKSQFARRASWHWLPSAWDRPRDIPYVFAGCLHLHAGTRKLGFSIEAPALVAIIEWMLRGHQSFGDLFNLAKALVVAHKAIDKMTVKWVDLPPAVRGKYQPHRGSAIQVYVPKFD